MKIDSAEISEYIRSIVKGVEDGIPLGYFPSSPIKIEISVSNVREGDGSIRLMVAGLGGKLKNEQNATIQVEVLSPLSEATKNEWQKAMKHLVEGALTGSSTSP